MDNPLVSIIMPVYNGGRYFLRSIPSVLAQDYDNRELIIVNDGSTDDTAELVKAFLWYPRISYHVKDHEWLGSTKNFGAKIAKGKYITFLDVDDQYLSTHIAQRLVCMQGNLSIDAIYGGMVVQWNPWVVDGRDTSRLINIVDTVQGPTLFARPEVFATYSYQNVFAEDYFFVQEAQQKFAIQRIDFPSYLYYRDNPESITNMQSKGSGI